VTSAHIPGPWPLRFTVGWRAYPRAPGPYVRFTVASAHIPGLWAPTI